MGYISKKVAAYGQFVLVFQTIVYFVRKNYKEQNLTLVKNARMLGSGETANPSEWSEEKLTD